jgi:hypothetical protein
MLDDDFVLLVVDSEEDTPENRAAAEAALRAKGVAEVRHITAYDMIESKVRLRSDGYVPRASYQEGGDRG